MRLIFASLAGHGHVYPLLPLAVAARDAGHDVVFATGEQFLPSLRKAGLEGVSAGISLDKSFSPLMPGGSERPSLDQLIGIAAEVFGSVVPRQVVKDLGPILTVTSPDLVVHESGNTGAGLAARIAGIPALCHGFGRESPSPMTDAIEVSFRSYAAELDVDLPKAHPFTLGNRYLDICPPSLQRSEFKAAVDRIELRPVAWNEPGELPAEIRDRRCPLVYLTLGTALGDAEVLRQAIEGLSALPVDVLVSTGPTIDVAALGDVGDNVRLEAWVPQGELLPHVDLVVHHGGSGTTFGALAAGKPQLVLPQGADQFTNAVAILEAGAGARLLPAELSAEAVSDLARRLLADESVRAAAGRFRDEIAGMPAPADVAARLPEFA